MAHFTYPKSYLTFVSRSDDHLLSLRDEHSIGELGGKVIVRIEWYEGEHRKNHYCVLDGVPHLKWLLQSSINLAIGYPCVHEIILDEVKQKLRFDIDVEPQDPNLYQFCLDQCLAATIKVFSTLGIELNLHRDVAVYTSHGPDKCSGHVVIQNWYCYSGKHLRELWRMIKAELHPCLFGSGVKRAIDDVYKPNQSMRIMGCSKAGSIRPRVKVYTPTFIFEGRSYTRTRPCPHDKEEFFTLRDSLVSCLSVIDGEEIPIQLPQRIQEEIEVNIPEGSVGHGMELLRAKYPEGCPYVIGEIQNGRVRLNRTKSSWCFVCGTIHDSENAMLFVGRNNIMFRCWRADKSVVLGMNAPLLLQRCDDDDIWLDDDPPLRSMPEVWETFCQKYFQLFGKAFPFKNVGQSNDKINFKRITIDTTYRGEPATRWLDFKCFNCDMPLDHGEGILYQDESVEFRPNGCGSRIFLPAPGTQGLTPGVETETLRVKLLKYGPIAPYNFCLRDDYYVHDFLVWFEHYATAKAYFFKRYPNGKDIDMVDAEPIMREMARVFRLIPEAEGTYLMMKLNDKNLFAESKLIHQYKEYKIVAYKNPLAEGVSVAEDKPLELGISDLLRKFQSCLTSPKVTFFPYHPEDVDNGALTREMLAMNRFSGFVANFRPEVSDADMEKIRPILEHIFVVSETILSTT